MNESCICGHEEKNHWHGEIRNCYFEGMTQVVLDSIGESDKKGCKCRKFKLDNLKLVEDLAKERNLV